MNGLARALVIALAFLFAVPAHARPPVWGGTPCTQDGTDVDGCYNGGSYQVPNFFTGYAIQSAGVSYPVGSDVQGAWPTSTSSQPTSGAYPVRPQWSVAGVDYAVGMPRSMLPTVGNLHPTWLKDPALIANDPYVNPDGPGADCNFYLTNTATGATGFQEPGYNLPPFPFPNGGPGIYCKPTGGTANPILFYGYNFSWNSATGYGCIPIYIGGTTIGSSASTPGTSLKTTSVQVSQSLIVNGPKCNIWGEFGQGSNTAGPNAPGNVNWLSTAFSPGQTASYGFLQDTFYGCGGDAGATALETALCSQTFNSTTYNAGSTEIIAGATVGVAPVQSNWVSLNGQQNFYASYNAMIHNPGRFGLVSVWANQGTVNSFDHNYGEGWIYIKGPQFQISSIASTGSNHYTITTVAPHGIAVGGSYAEVITAGSSGLSTCIGTYTMTALTMTTLQITAPSGCSAWTYVSGSYPYAIPQATHGEIFTVGANTTSATFAGSISGTTLTINPATAAFTGYISGTVLTISSLTSGTPVVGDTITSGAAAGTILTAGSGTSWTVYPSQTVGSSGSPVSMTTTGLTGTPAVGQYVTAVTGSGLTIPSPTYIVSGSGNTWTLNHAPGTMVGAMSAPEYTVGALGSNTTVNVSYNTILQTASGASDANTTLFYISNGGASTNVSLPYLVYTGSIDHNVMATNLVTMGSHRSTSAMVEWAYNAVNSMSLTKNYSDPTGIYYCWLPVTQGYSTATSATGNVNLISPSDTYINQMDSYSILPYVAGTTTNSQSMNGISYNSSTGVVTVTMSDSTLPPGFGIGSLFAIGNAKVTTGTNYLAGQHAVASVSGNTFTFNVGTGYPGTANSVNPELILYTASGGGKTCYGHN